LYTIGRAYHYGNFFRSYRKSRATLPVVVDLPLA